MHLCVDSHRPRSRTGSRIRTPRSRSRSRDREEPRSSSTGRVNQSRSASMPPPAVVSTTERPKVHRHTSSGSVHDDTPRREQDDGTPLASGKRTHPEGMCVVVCVRVCVCV
jgi:hypothetical protein